MFTQGKDMYNTSIYEVDEFLRWKNVQFDISDNVTETITIFDDTSSPAEDAPVFDTINTDSEDASQNNRTHKVHECDTVIKMEYNIHKHKTVAKTPSSDDDISSLEDRERMLEDVILDEENT